MKPSIESIIEEELSYIYCHNCKYNDNEEKCDDCNRKKMEWSISKETAISIANKIRDMEPTK